MPVSPLGQQAAYQYLRRVRSKERTGGGPAIPGALDEDGAVCPFVGTVDSCATAFGSSSAWLNTADRTLRTYMCCPTYKAGSINQHTSMPSGYPCNEAHLFMAISQHIP